MSYPYCMTYQHKEVTSPPLLELMSFHCFSMQYSEYRWPSDWMVVVIWPDTKKIITFWKVLTKSKQRSRENFEQLAKAVYDKFTVVKLHFIFIASYLKPFWTTYQINASVSLFLYTILFKLLTKQEVFKN